LGVITIRQVSAVMPTAPVYSIDLTGAESAISAQTLGLVDHRS
jgi:hypothetical protein